jgi:hypothetical protein
MGHVACTGAMRNTHKIYVDNLKGRDYLRDLCTDGRIILKTGLGLGVS